MSHPVASTRPPLVQTRVPQEAHDRLVELARTRHQKVAEYLRQVILEHVGMIPHTK